MGEYTANISIKARNHDEARVVSAQFQFPLILKDDMSKLLDSLTGGMSSLSIWADENEVIIGHIKGYLSWGEETIMLSTTGGEVQKKGTEVLPEPPQPVDVGIVSIVFGVQLNDIIMRLEQLVADAFGHFGYKYSFKHEIDHDHDHEHGHEHEHDHEHHHEHEHDHDHEIEHRHKHYHRHAHGHEEEHSGQGN